MCLLDCLRLFCFKEFDNLNKKVAANLSGVKYSF